MIDFKENIDSLEKMVWNFVLNPDNEFNELKPKSHDSLSRQELITLFKPGYFNEEARQESFKWALKFFREYDKIPNKKELRSYLEVSNANIEEEAFAELYSFNLQEYNYTYLYDYVKSFIMLKNLNMTVIDTLTYLKTVSVHPDNIGRVSEQVRNDISNKLALNFSNADTGLNFFDTDSHVQIMKNGSPTGFDFFDKTLGGGWNAKSLVVFIGRPKIGKCLSYNSKIKVRNKETGEITELSMKEFHDSLKSKFRSP